MTSSQFATRLMLGQVAPKTRVRTLVWRFKLSQTWWEEVLVDENYASIEYQEDKFRAAMTIAEFMTPHYSQYVNEQYGAEPYTVEAQHWRSSEV